MRRTCCCEPIEVILIVLTDWYKVRNYHNLNKYVYLRYTMFKAFSFVRSDLCIFRRTDTSREGADTYSGQIAFCSATWGTFENRLGPNKLDSRRTEILHPGLARNQHLYLRRSYLEILFVIALLYLPRAMAKNKQQINTLMANGMFFNVFLLNIFQFQFLLNRKLLSSEWQACRRSAEQSNTLSLYTLHEVALFEYVTNSNKITKIQTNVSSKINKERESYGWHERRWSERGIKNKWQIFAMGVWTESSWANTRFLFWYFYSIFYRRFCFLHLPKISIKSIC